MAASIFLTTSADSLKEAPLLSICGKTLRNYLSPEKSFLQHRFFGYVSAKVSDLLEDLKSSKAEERDYILDQIEDLDGDEEITVG